MIKASESEDKAHVTFTTATPAVVVIKHSEHIIYQDIEIVYIYRAAYHTNV